MGSSFNIVSLAPFRRTSQCFVPRIGQAPLYGIFFDDREYDYTKHLKSIGEHGDGIFIPAKLPPASSSKKSAGIEFRDEEKETAGKKVRFELPSEALPSAYEEDVGLLNRAAENKSELAGFIEAGSLDNSPLMRCRCFCRFTHGSRPECPRGSLCFRGRSLCR